MDHATPEEDSKPIIQQGISTVLRPGLDYQQRRTGVMSYVKHWCLESRVSERRWHIATDYK